MIIDKNKSIYLWKIEKRIKIGNILRNKYLMIKLHGNHGFFSYYIRQLGWIDYALKNKMIPVIDMQSSMNVFLREEEVGIINAYEYYFKQPCGISVDEAIKKNGLKEIVN